jgi:hypothetical protein
MVEACRRMSCGQLVDLRVGFANSGGLVFVDESAEEVTAT